MLSAYMENMLNGEKSKTVNSKILYSSYRHPWAYNNLYCDSNPYSSLLAGGGGTSKAVFSPTPIVQ